MVIESSKLISMIICLSMQLPKDWFLLVIILLVVAGDLLIVLLGTVIPSSRFYAAYIPDQEHPVSEDVRDSSQYG